jgi:hypothetical protein
MRKRKTRGKIAEVVRLKEQETGERRLIFRSRRKGRKMKHKKKEKINWVWKC